MELNQARIEEAIVAEVAGNMFSEESLIKRVQEAVDQRINKHFTEVADAQIKAAINKAIETGFEREYQRVNSFGEPHGPKTSIRKELEKLISGYWNDQVDKNGKPSTTSYGTTTRAEWMMTQLCAANFNDEMKQHVVNVGGALKDSLREQLHETVNKLLADVFHVRSLDDQGVDRRDRSSIDTKAKPIK